MTHQNWADSSPRQPYSADFDPALVHSDTFTGLGSSLYSNKWWPRSNMLYSIALLRRYKYPDEILLPVVEWSSSNRMWLKNTPRLTLRICYMWIHYIIVITVNADSAHTWKIEQQCRHHEKIQPIISSLIQWPLMTVPIYSSFNRFFNLVLQFCPDSTAVQNTVMLWINQCKTSVMTPIKRLNQWCKSMKYTK